MKEIIPKNKDIVRLFSCHPCGDVTAYNEKGEIVGKVWWHEIDKLKSFFAIPNPPCFDYKDAHDSKESCDEMQKEVELFIKTGFVKPDSVNLIPRKVN